VSNWVLGWRPMRKLMDTQGGVSAGAAMPAFARHAVKEGTHAGDGAKGLKVAYFAGCFEIFNEPGITRDALKVLEALGCDVLIPNQHCCGIPKISAGDAQGALDDMRYNLAVLVPLVEAGYTVTSGCPSCVLTLVDDYPDMAAGDARAQRLASNVRDLHDLVAEMLAKSPGAAGVFGESPWKGRRLAYHAPCHLRAAGKGEQPRRLLEKTLGLTFVVSNLKCCGMGGTFGIKSANAEMSQAIAKETVDRILAAKPEVLVTSCGMCRTQLEKQTGLPVYHPMELLAEAFVKVGQA
jgi:glycerol-3-phosphate dehydrogenase subunit C